MHPRKNLFRFVIILGFFAGLLGWYLFHVDHGKFGVAVWNWDTDLLKRRDDYVRKHYPGEPSLLTNQDL